MKSDWNIIGHKKQVDYLQKQIESGKINHAYLFVGPANLGKFDVAKQFSDVLFQDPIDKKNNKINPDFYLVEPSQDKKTQTITVAQVRELRKKFATKSWGSNWQIAIIKQADLMNLQAANALLKTLEEPGQQQIIILVAEYIDQLPKTIISRCQILKFLPVKNQEIEQYLLENSKDQDKNQIAIISSLANGQPNIAVQYLNKPSLFKKYQQDIDFSLNLFKQDKLNKRLSILEKVAKKDPSPFISLWLKLWRDILLIKNNQPNLIINHNYIKELTSLCKKYDSQKIKQIIRELEKIKNSTQNINNKLLLEDFVINYL